MALWSWITARISGEKTSSDADGTTSRSITAEAPPPAVTDQAAESQLGAQASWWSPQDANLPDLTELPRPDLSPEAHALENVLVLHFDGHNLELPSLPHVPERVLQMMGRRDFSMTDVAAEIGTDQVATAAVLRVANSPMYCAAQPMTAIEPAVVRLGTKAIRTLMMSLSMRSVAFREKRKGNSFAEDLWRRAMVSGHVMRLLSQFTHVDPEAASLIGLMHEVGSIVVLRIINQQHKVTGFEVDEPTFDYLCQEAHQEFGELLADAWKLPPQLKAIIADHTAYPTKADPLHVERLQLRLTNMICSLLGYAPHRPYTLLQSQAAQDLGLTDRDDVRIFLDRLPEHVADAFDAAL